MKKSYQTLTKNSRSHFLHNWKELFVFLLLPFLLYSSTSRALTSKNEIRVDKIYNEVTITDPPGPLAQALTGALKEEYDALVYIGLNAIERDQTILFFHPNPNAPTQLVAEISNNKLIYKYGGFGH